MTAPVSEGTSAEEAAEAVYSALDQLDQSGTNWVHHPSHFLPANVTTDWAGICWFKRLLADVLRSFFRAAPDTTPRLRWVRVSERLPMAEATVWVCVRNKNKEDGILLYDVCSHDGEKWRERSNTWETVVGWAYPVGPDWR